MILLQFQDNYSIFWGLPSFYSIVPVIQYNNNAGDLFHKHCPEEALEEHHFPKRRSIHVSRVMRKYVLGGWGGKVGCVEA